MVRNRRTGMILFIALVVAMIMMLWAIAATARANFQSGAVKFSYRKSECHYLAKTAINRSLALINTNPAWLTAHNGRNKADTTTTPGAECWAEVANGQTMLRSEARIGAQSAHLDVPLLRLDESDTQILSITPALSGGPDLIAWTSKSTSGWHPLPPIPGQSKILATAGAPNLDVFALTQGPTSNILWRYRTGQGWRQMPDTPSGVSLTSLSVGGDIRLVGRGSDNTLMVLPLGTSLNWTQVPAPAGTTLTNVAAHPTGQDFAYVTASDGGQEGVQICNLTTSRWSALPAPVSAHYDPLTGAAITGGGAPPSFTGGLAVDNSGDLFVASNQPGEASVIYRFDVVTPGSTTGSWSALPPVPALSYQNQSPPTFATDLRNLTVDDDGYLWVQRNDPTSSSFSIIGVQP